MVNRAKYAVEIPAAGAYHTAGALVVPRRRRVHQEECVTRIAIVLGWACVLVVAAAPAVARAQTPSARAYLNVDIGAQPQQRTFTTATSLSVYDESATVNTTQGVRNGPVFEISGGYYLTPRFAIGAGFSAFGRDGSGSLTASVPDPIFFDRPTTLTSSASALSHRERGVDVQAVWLVPLADHIDMALSAGPSFIRVAQDIATANIAAGQAITTANRTERGTAIGANAGVDFSYLFTPGVGVGLFARYAGGSVDLPSVSGLHVGGFRTGLGARLRF